MVRTRSTLVGAEAPGAGRRTGHGRRDVIALTRDRAAELANLSPRQVDYWAKTGLVQPTIDDRLSPQRPVRLYAYVELMSLMVAAELRSRKISLQAVRKIVGHLRERGFERPLAQLAFAATLGNDVYFQRPDGTWESNAQPDQIVMHQVLDLDVLRARIRTAGARRQATVGKVEQRRGSMGSKPVIAGTRVPVATVQRYLERGATVKQILESFPVLRKRDVEAVRREQTVA